ncbi:MAG: amino acid ABC transporter permease [Bacillota bacterium]|nr:amino acid ABC transporter permease [Bacillota bacterium]
MFGEFRWEVVTAWLPMLWKGVQMTIMITTIAVAVGTIIGLVVSLLRLSHIKPIQWFGKAYVDFLRGTPLLVQIMLVHFGGPEVVRAVVGFLHSVGPGFLTQFLPTEIRAFDAFFSGTLALSLNSGAYIAEIFRAGIQSIDRGQMEAARSLGMTFGQAMRYVVLPQAFKRSIPPLGNEFIAMLKDSSLVAIISVQELMMSGRIMQSRTFRPLETWLTVAFMYLVLTMTISQFVSYLERRFGKSDRSE